MTSVVSLMKKFITVLQKTTRHAGIGLVVLGLIVMAGPVAVFATQSDQGGEHQIEICHNGHTQEIDESAWESEGHSNHEGDFIIDETHPESSCVKVDDDDGDDGDNNEDTGTLIVRKVVVGSQASPSDFSFKIGDGPSTPFEADGQNDFEKNEGTYTIEEVAAEHYTTTYSSNVEGHGDDCSSLPVGSNDNDDEEDVQKLVEVEVDDSVICTITNTYHAPEEPASCTFGSDTTTVVSEAPAVASFVHPAWTHALESSGIMWIWNAFHATPSDSVDEIVTFTKTFNVVGTPSSVKLDLAADNYYSVSVNGTASCNDTVNLDNFSSIEPTCDITSLVHTGVNTLTFVVTNKSGFGTDPETNPGGLIYKVTLDGASCSEVPPPVDIENSCVQPSTEGGPEHIAIGDANFFGEIPVQQILNNAGYSSTNADTDQMNAQAWTDTGSTVSFSVKALSKNAADAHVFGYVLNGASFVGVFRDANTGNVTYDALPLRNSSDDGVATFDLPNVTSVSFAILDVQSGKIYSTKKADNDDSMNHAVVYNPLSNMYVIGFEDVSGGDGDMNDLAVEVTVTGCREASDTATIHAQKVVCTNETDLPNWGTGGPDIASTTAQTWVSAHESCSLVPWDFQWAPAVATNPGDNATGTPTGWSAFVNGVTSVPAGALVWVREQINTNYISFTGAESEDNVSAEFYCSTDVLNYDNYDFIDPVVAGTDYYCVGFNAPKSQEETNTASTIVVKYPNLETETNLALAVANNSGKWFYYNDTTDVIDNALGSFVTGPAVAPLGTGSSEMIDPDATGRIDIATFGFSGTKLADIKTLAFSSYSHSGISGPDESPYLVFNVSFDGLDTYQRRLVYVPGNNGAVPQDVWNTNDTIQSGAGKWVYSGPTWPITGEPGTTTKTWSQILSDYPAAKVLQTGGLMGIRVGEPGPAGYTGDTDKFVIGIKTGSNIDTRTYDFEPSPVCSDGKDNDQDEAIDASDPGCHSDGNAGNSESYLPNDDSEVNDPGPSETSNITVPKSHGSPSRGSRVLGATTGQVLGEACGLYMDKHLRLGSGKNDVEQTKKLQIFLNKWMTSNLPVTGFYGPLSTAAVKAFQSKYSDQILKPWGIQSPTGIVYFSTLREINLLECPELSLELPPLIDWSKNPKPQ